MYVYSSISVYKLPSLASEPQVYEIWQDIIIIKYDNHLDTWAFLIIFNF